MTPTFVRQSLRVNLDYFVARQTTDDSVQIYSPQLNRFSFKLQCACYQVAIGVTRRNVLSFCHAHYFQPLGEHNTLSEYIYMQYFLQ